MNVSRKYTEMLSFPYVLLRKSNFFYAIKPLSADKKAGVQKERASCLAAHKQKPGWANGPTGAASCHSKAPLTTPVRGHTKFLTGSRARGILSILSSPLPALTARPPRKQLRSNQFLNSVTHWPFGAWPMPGEGRYGRSCSPAAQKLSCSAGVPRDCRI